MIIAVFPVASCASVQDKEASEFKAKSDRNKGVMEKYIQYFNAGNWAEDLSKVVASHYPGGEQVVGMELAWR